MGMSDAKFMELALDRFHRAKEADASERSLAVNDLEFYLGDQWDSESIKARDDAKLPRITFNRLMMFTNQISNQSRANDHSIGVEPADGAPEEVAEPLQMRIRQIEYQSKAKVAHDNAQHSQIVCGRGFERLRMEFVERSMLQRPVIEAIANPFSVYWDPNAVDYDLSDAEFVFVITTMTVEEHSSRYKRSRAAASNYFTDSQNPAPKQARDWFKGKKKIQVADYYTRTAVEKTLVEMPDGTTKLYDTSGEVPPEMADYPTRAEKCYKVMHYVIDGVECHEETEWVGSTIPITPYWGMSITDAQGKKRTISLIRPAKEPQKTLNHAVSGLVAMLSISPKNVWLGVEGIFDTTTQWKSLHQMAFAYAEYKALDVQGNPAPPPQLMTHEPPIQAQLEAMAMATDGIKAALGIFDASIGAESNEKSGLAIQTRQKQSDAANYHFQANAILSIESTGRKIVEILGLIDAKRETVQGRTYEGKTVRFPVNQEHQMPGGKQVLYDTNYVNPYSMSIVVDAGPSFKSARDEAHQQDGDMIRALPELMWVIGDQYFETSNAPGAKENAKRIRKVIEMKSPGVIENPDEQQGAPLPPEVQAQMQKDQQQIQQLSAAVEGLSAEKESKSLEFQSRERIEDEKLTFAREKLAAEVEMEMAKLGDARAFADMRHDLDFLKQQIQASTVKAQMDHTSEMKQMDQQEAAEQQQAPQPGAPPATDQVSQVPPPAGPPQGAPGAPMA